MPYKQDIFVCTYQGVSYAYVCAYVPCFSLCDANVHMAVRVVETRVHVRTLQRVSHVAVVSHQRVQHGTYTYAQSGISITGGTDA